jgi:hypothetical protein
MIVRQKDSDWFHGYCWALNIGAHIVTVRQLPQFGYGVNAPSRLRILFFTPRKCENES